jgi:uncharacterized protein
VNLPIPLIGFGQVRHTRVRPVRHAFAYPTYFLMLPLRAIQRSGSGILAHNRSVWLSYFDSDQGDGRSPGEGGALGWVEELLHSQGIVNADGEIWLHCFPRVLGYTFKPVSFWYCHRRSGELRAIVVEVNNTFGERHCYLLDAPHYGQELRAAKVFHVSPFCRVEGDYRFRFMRTERDGVPQTVVRIDHDDAQGSLLQTSVSGVLEPATRQAIRKAIWRYPAMTLGVIARIHWQALKLWCKRVPLVSKPPPPQDFVTRSTTTSYLS